MRVVGLVFAAILVTLPSEASGQVVPQLVLSTDTTSDTQVVFEMGSSSRAYQIGPEQATPQPQWKPDQLCTIEGVVVKSTTGEPVRKIVLSIYPAGGPGAQQQHSAMTDATGHFVLRDVEPGKYFMHAGGNGFPYQMYQAKGSGRRGKMFSLEPGQHEKDIVFSLMPGAVITGAVYDDDGDPVVGAAVQAFRMGRASRQRGPGAGAQTNDRGEYRIFGLEPGQYYVVAERQNQNEGTDEVFLPTYYPGTADPTQATPVQVRAGDEMAAINLDMTKTHGSRVRGRVSWEGARKMQGAPYIQLVPRGRESGFSIGRTFGAPVHDQTGNFEILGVPPGSYVAVANWNDGKTNLSGSAPVDVSNVDVEGVLLVLGAGYDLRGRIRTYPPSKLDLTHFNVWLEPRGPSMMGGGGAEMQGDGTFVIRNLFDGNYTIRVGHPEEYYLKSARLGGADVLASGLSLSHSQAPGTLEVELSLNGGSISGTVLHDQKPVPGALVVLVPDPPNRNQDDMYSSTAADQYGRFQMMGLAPSEYKLFAWDSPDGFNIDVRDPEFLKPYEDHGKSVRVEEKHQQNVQLESIPVDEEP